MIKFWLLLVLCLAIVARCHSVPEWADEHESKEESEEDRGNGMELISDSDYSETEYESGSDSQEVLPAQNGPATDKKPALSKRTMERTKKSEKPRLPNLPTTGTAAPKKSLTEDRAQDGSKLRCYTCAFIRGKTDSACIDPQNSNAMLVKCDTTRSSCFTSLVRRDNNMLDAVIRGCSRSPSNTDPDTNYCRTDRCNSLPYNYPELLNFKTATDSGNKLQSTSIVMCLSMAAILNILLSTITCL